MAGDNVIADQNTTQGATFRCFSDGTVEWPATVCAFVSGGSAGAWTLQQVDATHGLPVAVLGTVPVSGTFWQATQPVSAASLPLPTGAATAAKQPALGTAGAASADVLTVQGVASMTALKVDGSAVTQPVSGTVTANIGTGNLAGITGTVTVAGTGTFAVQAAQSGTWTAATNADAALGAGAAPSRALIVGAQYNTAAPTPTNGQTLALQTDSSGNLKVNVAAGGASGGTSSSFSSTFPATGTAAGASDGTNMKPLLVDASGFLKVNVAAGGASGGTSSSYAAAFPATGTAVGFSDGTNMQAARAFDADTGAGTQYVLGANLRISGSGGSVEAKGSQTSANSIPVVIASDQGSYTVAATQSGTWNVGTVTAVTGITNAVTVVGAAASGASKSGNPVQVGAVFNTTQPTVTTGQVVEAQATARGARIVATGVDTFHVTVDNATLAVTQSGSWSLAANQSVNLAQVAGASTATGHGTASGALRVELPTDGTGVVNAAQSGTWTVQPGNTANTTPWLVTDTPATSGGLSADSYISSGAANQDQHSVKGSAGQLYGYAAYNTTASARYLKFYNLASPTSASTPALRVYLPAGGGSNVNIDKGVAFGTAISIRLTTGAADADTGACAANDVLFNAWFK